MADDAEPRALELAIPSQPDSLVKLSLLLAEDDLNMSAIARLIESDMALAAAVLKAVNSSLYGLQGRVQSVQQAVTYLGMREVAGITFEMGLRAAFGPAAELEPLWRRAGQRGMLMGRLAQRMSLDAWAAHSAGLFEECGKAVLFRHAADHYRAMLRAAQTDAELRSLELAGFGVGHDDLGATLCEGWGLSAEVVIVVRHHVSVQETHQFPAEMTRCGLAALSVIVNTLLTRPASLDEVVGEVAPLAGLDTTLATRASRQVEAEWIQTQQREAGLMA